MRGVRESLIGLSFGRLTVISRDEAKRGIDPNSWWVCKCDCGTSKSIIGQQLKSGGTLSCGCYRKEFAKSRVDNGTSAVKRTHGMTKTPEHRTWGSMIQRCENKKHQAFSNYGGRGIKVCQQWRDSFQQFFIDMGNRPKGTSLDRINVNGDYEPSNCRWATDIQQKNNRRDNRYIKWEGETYTLSNLAKKHGITYNILSKRLAAGWDIENALTIPTKVMNREITHNNETKTVKEWSEKSGIPVERILERIANGWSFEKALTQPLRYSKTKLLP